MRGQRREESPRSCDALPAATARFPAKQNPLRLAGKKTRPSASLLPTATPKEGEPTPRPPAREFLASPDSVRGAPFDGYVRYSCPGAGVRKGKSSRRPWGGEDVPRARLWTVSLLQRRGLRMIYLSGLSFFFCFFFSLFVPEHSLTG